MIPALVVNVAAHPSFSLVRSKRADFPHWLTIKVVVHWNFYRVDVGLGVSVLFP